MLLWLCECGAACVDVLGCAYGANIDDSEDPSGKGGAAFAVAEAGFEGGSKAAGGAKANVVGFVGCQL